MESMPVVFDYDWIKEFLGLSDKESDDSDDVVVVREFKPERKSKSSRPAAKDLDDDCIILDGDPENRVTSVNESANESDELHIVGEKGQIACRDYPHPRHLCVLFPFSSNPHEKHCGKCHCYVCDLPAPCLKWGTGISATDHCHATEKVDIWKIQRENFKLRKSAPLPASTNYGNSLCVGHPQHNHVLPPGLSRFSSNSISQIQASRSTTMRTCPPTNPIHQNHDSWPTVMRACSSSLNSTVQKDSRINTIPMCSSTTNFTVPNSTNHGRRQESAPTFIRNRYQPHLVSRQLLGVRNNAFQRDRRRGSSSLCPQFPRRHIISNGLGSVGGTLPVNHSAHGVSYPNYVNPAEHCNKYHDATELSNDRTCNGWNNSWLPINVSSYPDTSSGQPSLNFNDENIVASEIQVYSQPSLLENGQNFYQSCIQGNGAPSNYVASLSSNQHGNEHQIRSQIENAGRDITQCGNSNQDACQQESFEPNQGGTARKADISFFDLVMNENTIQSIEPLSENYHLETRESINQPPNFPNFKESNTLLAGSTNLSSLVDFENWLMEKDSALQFELNISSPDPVPVDTGTLFCDFDTSWNGLAHA